MRTRAISGTLLLATTLGCLTAGCETAPAISEEEMAAIRARLVDHPAPDFTLQDQERRTVTPGGLRGQWGVLYFYPYQDMPGCSSCKPTEFSEILTEFKDVNAKVHGVSDTGPDNVKVYADTYKPGIDILSDRDHSVSSRYGAWVGSGGGGGGQVIRIAVIVDPTGVVRYHSEVTAKGRAKAVSQALARLRGESQPSSAGSPQ